MIENQPSSSPTTPIKTKKVSIQERSIHVGDFVVVNGYRVNRTLLKERFAQGGYQADETKHFLLFTRAEEPKNILVHWFPPEETLEEPQEDIKQIVLYELTPLNIFKLSSDPDDILQGILDSSHMPQIRLQEQAVPVGDMRVMNGSHINRDVLKRRFFQWGYQVQETTHFSLFERKEEPKIILVHHFTLEEMNADIKHYMMMELKPLRLIKGPDDYTRILTGIIGSFFPEDMLHAWHYYAAKSLQRFLLFLSTARTSLPFNFYATIGAFTTWYQRVCELCIGESFLDAGCDSGFLPLIIAERIPFMKRIVGVDIQTSMFSIMEDIAEERNLHQIQFIQADLLTEDIPALGQFDTVVILGVIEHFYEEDMYRVLKNLLTVTTHRLILTIPYEQEPEIIYEHKQVFTRAKLEALGQWCIQQLDGMGRMWCEDCDGGLLLVERLTETR